MRGERADGKGCGPDMRIGHRPYGIWQPLTKLKLKLIKKQKMGLSSSDPRK